MEDEPSINHAYQFIQNACKYTGNTQYSFGKLDQIYFNSTLYLVDPQNATALTKNNQTLYSPVDVQSKSFNKQYRAAYAAKRQYDLGTIFGCIMIFYWVFIGFMGTISHFILQKYPELLFRHNPLLTKIRKYFVLPATFKGSHSRPVKIAHKIYLSAPTRGQSLILLGYFIMNTVLLLVEYDIYKANPYLSTSNQILTYLGNRTGIISFTQLPLVIVFAARNNVFIKLTGWSYSTMQVYHRWIARIMMIHVVIHFICFTILAVRGHTLAFKWRDVINWRFGNMAAYSGILMIIMSYNIIRENYYEIFSLFHKLFYVIFMIGIFRHCWDFGWMGWVYASLAIHAMELLVRFYNVVLSGWTNKAHMQLYDGNVFRVSVKYSKRWALRPGQFCYLRILHKNIFWQAHPFSVYQSQDEQDGDLHFAVKAQNGATALIANYLDSQPGKAATLSVMVDGPYGVYAPVEKYDTVFLIAGGMGVTATYSYALHLQNLGKRGQRIVFIWIVQDMSSLEWLGDELFSLTSSNNIEVQIYITRNFDANQYASESDVETSSMLSSAVTDDSREKQPRDSQITLLDPVPSPRISMSQRSIREFGNCLYDKRPDIHSQVTKFLSEYFGNIAIVSCGPARLVDAIRKSIIKNLEEPEGRVDYYEEAFSW